MFQTKITNFGWWSFKRLFINYVTQLRGRGLSIFVMKCHGGGGGLRELLRNAIKQAMKINKPCFYEMEKRETKVVYRISALRVAPVSFVG